MIACMEVDVMNRKVSFREKINRHISKIRGMKKRYYVIFGLLILFFVYNTVSLRGFYYTKNSDYGFFGFMDWWIGYTNSASRSVPRDGVGGDAPRTPRNIHDTDNGAYEWYGSIYGTIVFMKWKWVGIHIGDYAILIDTSVPKSVYVGDHILGHPYYILEKYDPVDNYPTDDERGEKVLKEWEERFGGRGSFKKREAIVSKRAASWRKNEDKYRLITRIYYCVILLIYIGMFVCLIRNWRRSKRRRLEETLQ